MSIWQTYPSTYRQKEVQQILAAVCAGECVSVVGLSGAGKSNLMGFLAQRPDVFPQQNVLIDCNRLRQPDAAAFFRLICITLGEPEPAADDWQALESAIAQRLADNGGSLTLLLDRFEILANTSVITANLRALRDAHKYQLTLVIATRHPLEPHTELAELFFAHTLWLGPLNESDTYWNIARYAERIGQKWAESEAEIILELTWGYPSLLRAVCEAYAGGTHLALPSLREHAAIQRRVAEFWSDDPAPIEVRLSSLEGQPLLERDPDPERIDHRSLTAKEVLLLAYFQAHSEEVCSKDDLVRAVWPEDKIYQQGIRDDSLAQLVRRLRVKIEPDPSAPVHIHTVPGRGYQYTPG